MSLTRTQIQAWNPSTLTDIANAWTTLGSSVESLFDRYVDAVTKSGADYWEGGTAEAAQTRASSDRKAAVEVVDHVQAIADRARRGFYEIDGPLQRVRAAILGAETECLTVSDALTVGGGFILADEERTARITLWQSEIDDAASATESADKTVRDALASAREGLRLFFTSAATLGGEQGKSDASALVSDPSALTPEQQHRLVEAGRLTPEQLDALRTGETATIPASQMEYLEQLARAMDGKSPQEIADIVGRLPEDARGGVADALQILSNDKVTATVVGDSDVPTHGGFDRLPESIRASLTRDDLVVEGYERVGYTVLPSIALNGVADNQAIASIVDAGSDEYKNGSSLDSHLLDVGRQYLDAQVRHEQNPDHTTEFFTLDGYGTKDTRITEDIFAAVGSDKIAVHDAVTDADRGQDFIRDTLTHHWSDDGHAVSSLFDFDPADSVVADPNNAEDVATAERTGGIMSAVGKAIATDEWSHLSDVAETDRQSVGQLNPKLLNTLSHSMSPYIADLAGLPSDDRPGFDNSWVDPSHTGKYAGATQVFALMNTDHDAGTYFTEHAQAEILASEGRYAEDPRDAYAGRQLMTVGILHGLVDEGITTGLQDEYSDKAELAQAAYDRKSAAFDALSTLGTAGIGELPGGGYVNTMIDLVGDPLKDSLVGVEPDGPHEATLAGYDPFHDFYNILSARPDLPPDVTRKFEDMFDEDGTLLPYDPADSRGLDTRQQTALETMFNRLGNASDGNSHRIADAYGRVILKDG
ncbi:TPR repeat region-containing protein [Rhodococcoides yunnanense]|uniref:TPR repeat region-containing protein n=1 Tax=Rhodococcoides yunnanense TaxID=278209 RepID=UPI0009335B80|nr:hypothetical protein [Rhodococcus yunnanensis]